MYEWIADTFGVGDGIARAMSFIIALAIVFALIGLMVYFLRQFTGNRINAGRNRQPRIAVMDAMNIDARRRLLLVRRDNVEHLILVGGPTDVVVEQTIIRGTPVAANYQRQLAGYGAPDYDAGDSPVPAPAAPPVAAMTASPAAASLAPAPAVPPLRVQPSAPDKQQAAPSGPQRLAANLAARAAAAAGSLAASARARGQNEPQVGSGPAAQASAPSAPRPQAQAPAPEAPALRAQTPQPLQAPQTSVSHAPQTPSVPPASSAGPELKPVSSPLDTIKTLRARAAEAMSAGTSAAAAPSVSAPAAPASPAPRASEPAMRAPEVSAPPSEARPKRLSRRPSSRLPACSEGFRRSS
ncbi:hypothetical protein V6L77_03245 [Pannonibacter sp. Pt2-lr]